MNALSCLTVLSSHMHLEPSEDTHCPQVSPGQQDEIFISQAVLPNGKCIRLLKTLLSSACERDCLYCPFRAGRDMRRETFRPEEFARLFHQLYTAGIAEGLFLSSGIAGGGVRTQDKLLATAEILRDKLGYRGYLHLKIMPGAEAAQIEQAMHLADRVSINLEAPNPQRLQQLAPHKDFHQELIRALYWVEHIRKTQPSYQGWRGRWPSLVTQFVVGGADESDLEILHTTDQLHHKFRLARAYFSAFHPIVDTPLENKPPTSPTRQLRLYQSSFLIRDYGFQLEELPFDSTGNLPLKKDPKLAWAEENLAYRPVEINTASREELLKVPGIGVKGVQTILATRRERKIRDLSTLRKMGIAVQRAAPFLLLAGVHSPRQFKLL
jgi:predicted DNA-binding helix-hairpin-helix protein